MNKSTFDSETIEILRSVLRSSVEMLPEPLRTPSSTVSLASHLLSAAAEGHRSRAALVVIGTQAALEFCQSER